MYEKVTTSAEQEERGCGRGKLVWKSWGCLGLRVPVDRRARSMCSLGVCSERASERDVSVANEAVVKETAPVRTAGTLSEV